MKLREGLLKDFTMKQRNMKESTERLSTQKTIKSIFSRNK